MDSFNILTHLIIEMCKKISVKTIPSFNTSGETNILQCP